MTQTMFVPPINQQGNKMIQPDGSVRQRLFQHWCRFTAGTYGNPYPAADQRTEVEYALRLVNVQFQHNWITEAKASNAQALLDAFDTRQWGTAYGLALEINKP